MITIEHLETEKERMVLLTSDDEEGETRPMVTAEVDDRRRLFEVVVVADAMLVKYYEPA
jgi:hypothetical protein